MVFTAARGNDRDVHPLGIVESNLMQPMPTRRDIHRWPAFQVAAERVFELSGRTIDDVGPIEALVTQVIDGRLDAVAFTNQVQVRHLFEIGERRGRSATLRYALRHRTVVGSIGPTCSAALEAHGVAPHVVASPPKMRPLVTAIGAHLAARRDHPTAETTP
jgi:hypothetical protein